MRKSLFFVLFTLIIWGCASQPSGGGGGNNSVTSSSTGIVISQTDGAETIESLPDLKLKLKDMPDSLSDPNLKLKSIRPKKIGDISTLIPENIPESKSTVWYDLMLDLQSESMVQTFIQNIKEATFYGLTIPVGQTTSLDQYTKVYCQSDGNGGLEFYFRTFEVEFPNTNDSKLYIHVYPVNDKSAVEFIMEQQDIKLYSYYNEDTKEIVDSYLFETIEYSDFLYKKTYWDSPTSLSIIKINENQMVKVFSIGWGNNNYGGIVNSVKAIDMGTNVNVEYYNNNGGLVYKAFGNIENENDFSYFDTYGFNISQYFTISKPDNINLIFEDWYDNFNSGSKIYLSNSGTITEITNNVYYLYFYNKTGSSWQSGDCIYTLETYDGETNYEINSTNIHRYYYTYTKTLVIPSPKIYLEIPYYFYSYWPIKYLSLASQYSNYAITRKVKEEYSYTNIYINFENQARTNIYTWQTFDWWLDKEKDTNFNTNIDININGVLQEEDVYIFNDSLSDFVQSKTIMSYGTEDNPPYFIFNGTNIVNSVKTKIENIYNTYKETNFVNLITNKTIPNTNLFPNF